MSGLLPTRDERRFLRARWGRPLDHAQLAAELRRAAKNGERPAGVREAVRAELAPFAGRTIDARAREAAYRQRLERDPLHVARFHYRDGHVVAEGPRAGHERALWTRWAIELLARTFALPPFAVVLHFGDELASDAELAPLLVYCRKSERRGLVLIPDHEALAGHEALEREVDRAARTFPWEKKQPIAFWRGATTGGYFDRPGWRDLPRARLVQHSRARPDLIDARFTRLIQGAERNPELGEPGWQGPSVSPGMSLRFRYLLDVDGNAASWTRLAWTLRSNSLVMKQESPYEQWFHRFLGAGVHYVTLAGDLSDLGTRILWAREHEREARAVAEAGAAFARVHLERKASFLYLLVALESLIETGAA